MQLVLLQILLLAPLLHLVARMKSRLTRSMNLASLSHGGDCNQDRQEVPKHPDSDNCDMEGDKESPSGANKQKEKDEMVTAMPGRSTPAAECLPLTIIKQMEEMFFNLGFSQVVAEKLVYDQGIDSPWILASLSDKNITVICDVIRRCGELVGSKTPDRENQISVLAAKALKLAAFMLKMLENCSRAYDIRCINSTSLLMYQHQWELKQKKSDNLKEPKVGKNNWAKTTENIVLHIKLIKGVRRVLLAYVV